MCETKIKEIDDKEISESENETQNGLVEVLSIDVAADENEREGLLGLA